MTDMPWSTGKQNIRDCLIEVTKDNSLEYTLFRPGLILDYLAFPHKTATHLEPLQTIFDFEGKRAVVVDGYEDALMAFTTIKDLAAVVARGVGPEARWPKNGGVAGNRLLFSQAIDLGERMRNTGEAFATFLAPC